jgi:hypothetical protein
MTEDALRPVTDTEPEAIGLQGNPPHVRYIVEVWSPAIDYGRKYA